MDLNDRTQTPRSSKLLPESLVAKAPAPVKRAQAEAEKALAAYDQGIARKRQARRAATDAPAVDAEALAAASRERKDPPAPTEEARRLELGAAVASARVLDEEARKAIHALHLAIIEHLPALLEAERSRLADVHSNAVAAAEEFRRSLDELATEGGVIRTLLEADDYDPHPRRGKRLKHVGRLDFAKRREGVLIEAEPVLASVDSLLVEDDRETAGQRTDREMRDHENRGPRLGRGDQRIGLAVAVVE